MQENHKQLIWTFKEVLSVNADLWYKIITAVDAKYITALRNCNTNYIKKIINVILKHILYTYEEIRPKMLTQCEDVIKQMTLDVDAPTGTVFSDAEELVDISTTDLHPYTDQKYINLGYNIINKTILHKISL